MNNTVKKEEQMIPNSTKPEHMYWMLIDPNKTPNYEVYKFFAYDTHTGMYHFIHFRNKSVRIARSYYQLNTPQFRPVVYQGGGNK